jgi:hypothetical protein
MVVVMVNHVLVVVDASHWQGVGGYGGALSPLGNARSLGADRK